MVRSRAKQGLVTGSVSHYKRVGGNERRTLWVQGGRRSRVEKGCGEKLRDRPRQDRRPRWRCDRRLHEERKQLAPRWSRRTDQRQPARGMSRAAMVCKNVPLLQTFSK